MKKQLLIVVFLSIVFGFLFPRFIGDERHVATTYDGCGGLSECGQGRFQKGFPFAEQKKVMNICGLYLGPVNPCGPDEIETIETGWLLNSLFWTTIFITLSFTAIKLYSYFHKNKCSNQMPNLERPRTTPSTWHLNDLSSDNKTPKKKA